MKRMSYLLVILLLFSTQLLFSQESTGDNTTGLSEDKTDIKETQAEKDILVIFKYEEYPYDIVDASLTWVEDKDFYSKNGNYITKNISKTEKQPDLKEPAKADEDDKKDKDKTEKSAELTSKEFYNITFGQDGLIQEVQFEKYDETMKMTVPTHQRNFDYVKYYKIAFNFNNGLLKEKVYKEVNGEDVCKYIYSRDGQNRINKLERKLKKRFIIKGEIETLETRNIIEFVYGDSDTTSSTPSDEASSESKTSTSGTTLTRVYNLDKSGNILEQYIMEPSIPKGLPSKVENAKKHLYVGEIKIPIWMVKKYFKYKRGTTIGDKDNETNYLYYFTFEPKEGDNAVRLKQYYTGFTRYGSPKPVLLTEYIESTEKNEKSDTDVDTN